MYFDSVSAALAMDGHGVFVWSAYIITLAALAGLLVVPRYRERRLFRQLAGELRREEALSERKD